MNVRRRTPDARYRDRRPTLMPRPAAALRKFVESLQELVRLPRLQPHIPL